MVVNKIFKRKVNYRPVPDTPRFALPGICYLCSGAMKSGDLFVCAACKKDLPENIPACPQCALPVTVSGMVCGRCLYTANRLTGGFFAPFLFAFPVDRMIHDLKFHARLEIAGFLGRWMAETAVTSGIAMPQCFIPVPLHMSRVAGRGYNQSLEIARVTGLMLDIPVCYDLCNRTVNTPPQSKASVSERERNLKGAFAIIKNGRPVPGHVAIVDDVITTGTTVTELARVLDKYGVTRIDVWAAARTPFRDVAAAGGS